MKRKGYSMRGGFYPSVMGGVATTGPYFVTAALVQASRLIKNNRTRMAARKRIMSRKQSRRRTKRTKRS